MAEITLRRIGELVRGVFRILRDAPDGVPAREVLVRLVKEVPPTAFELTEYPKRPGVRRYEKIVRFSTVTPVKAGWMVKSAGRWILTDEGRRALEQFPDSEAFSREARRLYKEWAAGREDGQETTESETAWEEVTATSAFEEAEEAAWTEIENHLSGLDPYAFQRLVASLLKGMGYHVDWVAPPGPDQGIDILAYPDPLGTREPLIKVSVRRRPSAKADVKDLREFLSLLHGSDVGIFVSLSGFTKPAEDHARQEQRRIRLLDLRRLVDLWIEHYDHVPSEDRALLPLRELHFLVLPESP